MERKTQLKVTHHLSSSSDEKHAAALILDGSRMPVLQLSRYDSVDDAPMRIVLSEGMPEFLKELGEAIPELIAEFERRNNT